MIVAGSYQYLGFLIFGTQKGRDDFLIVVPDAMDDQFLDAPKACGAAAGVTAFLPGVRSAVEFAANSYVRFGRSVWIVFNVEIDSLGRARVLETFLCFDWLRAAAFFVREFCDGARKF